MSYLQLKISAFHDYSLRLLIVIFVLSFLVAPLAKAVILIPYFNITIVKNSIGDDVNKPNGGMLLEINGRYWITKDDMTLVPYLSFMSETQGIDGGTATGKTTASASGFMLGLGLIQKIILLIQLQPLASEILQLKQLPMQG